MQVTVPADLALVIVGLVAIAAIRFIPRWVIVVVAALVLGIVSVGWGSGTLRITPGPLARTAMGRFHAWVDEQNRSHPPASPPSSQPAPREGVR